MAIGELLIILGIFAVFGLMGLVGIALLVLMLKQSVQRKGNWGINVRREDCPRCGLKLPSVRRPANVRQAMWGGCTCQRCGAELDKWGQVNKG